MKAIVLVLDDEHADDIARIIGATLRLNRYVTNEPQVIDWPILSNVDANTEGQHHGEARSTERAAAMAVMPKTGTQRRKVLEAIRDSEPDGLTDEEVADRTGLYLYSAAPRRTELVAGGWLHDSGRQRPTRRGQAAIVWTLTPAAWARLAEQNGRLL